MCLADKDIKFKKTVDRVKDLFVLVRSHQLYRINTEGFFVSKLLNKLLILEKKYNSSFGTYKCKICKQTKKADEFWKDKSTKTGLSTRGCKICLLDYYHNYNKEYFKHLTEEQLQKKNSRTYLRKYGITMQDKIELFNKQKEKCAICNLQLSINKCCIDHNHKTGKVRGILCDNCNKGLGHLKDNIDNFTNALIYLKAEFDENK